MRTSSSSWGSSAGVCREALGRARGEGLRAKLLIPYLLHPLAEDVYEQFFASVKGGLVVEQSHQGQLFRILRMFLDVPAGMKSMCRSGSNPILPTDVQAALRGLARNLQRDIEEKLQLQE